MVRTLLNRYKVTGKSNKSITRNDASIGEAAVKNDKLCIVMSAMATGLEQAQRNNKDNSNEIKESTHNSPIKIAI